MKYTNLMYTMTPLTMAAAKKFRRSERFIDGFSVERELIKLCNEFFGDKIVNEHNGLRKQYAQMKEKVVNDGLLGLVLNGIEEDSIFICNYTTQSLDIIHLTVASLTRTLLTDFFTEAEIEQHCESIPGIENYVTDPQSE